MGRPLVSLTSTRQPVARSPVAQRHTVSSRELAYLPRWRGFGLPDLDTEKVPFNQSDFQIIAQYGFNFVRLAMGYQYITSPITTSQAAAPGAEMIYVNALTVAIPSGYKVIFGITGSTVVTTLSAPANIGDTSLTVSAIKTAIPSGEVSYSVLDPVALGYIDQAISWCLSLGIHVMLDMHETLGYSVLNPSQSPSLWLDYGCMLTLAQHWSTLATRYKGISSTQLSFNLLNEPEGINHINYAGVIKIVINAVKAVDPTRKMFCDGMPTALVPTPELIGTGVGQAYHGLYTPMTLSHYGAIWLTNWSEFAVPAWPDTLFVNMLWGNDYPDYILPVIVKGTFSPGDTISLNISQCNIRAQYQIWDADNNILVVDTGLLTMTSSGPGTPYEDPIWHVWSNINLGVVATGTVTEATTQLEIRVPNGNWSTIANITTYNHGNTAVLTPNTTEMAGYYGLPATTLTLDDEGNYVPADSNWNIDTIRELVKAWSDLLTKRGIDIMSTEGGVFHTVPESIALAALSDHLQVLKEFSIGFTIWMLRGNFGVFDSGRNMTGICNVNGTTVTFVSGTATGMGAQTAFFFWPPGQTITLPNGVFTITAVDPSLSFLTLTASAGVQNGVAFSYGNTNYETVTFPDESVHYLDTAMMSLLQSY
jgi:hypothetical protein